MKIIAKILIGALMALAIDLAYLGSIWPDWKDIAQGSIPKSKFIAKYQENRKTDPRLPTLKWNPSNQSIPKDTSLPFIVAEDSRFYSHEGVDLKALAEAMNYNIKAQKVVFGASTISQQTVKNLFLSSSKHILRKWHELVLTVAMESHLRKARILQIYLNIAEFGKGIYGIHAAAKSYFGKSMTELTTEELVELAATLPSPKKHNPSSRTASFLKRKDRILTTIQTYYKSILPPPDDQDPELTEYPVAQ